MINTNVRLTNFLSDGDARKRYRRAISELEDLHIFDILREVHSVFPIALGAHQDGNKIDMMNYHRTNGYMQALNDIQYLADIKESSNKTSAPDFGAYDSLIKEGYTSAEIEKMLSDD